MILEVHNKFVCKINNVKYNKQIGTEKKSGMFRFALLGYRGLKIKNIKNSILKRQITLVNKS